MSNKTPFKIHSLATEGISIVIGAVTPFTAESVTIYPGDDFEITADILELNRDRHGRSFLDLSPAEQVEKWGTARFGLGETPEHVRAAAEAKHLERLRTERDILLRRNPGLAKANAAQRRMADLDALLGRD